MSDASSACCKASLFQEFSLLTRADGAEASGAVDGATYCLDVAVETLNTLRS